MRREIFAALNCVIGRKIRGGRNGRFATGTDEGVRPYTVLLTL